MGINTIWESIMSYTPTPHGTGVLTVCGLLENTIKAYKKRNKLE